MLLGQTCWVFLGLFGDVGRFWQEKSGGVGGNGSSNGEHRDC